MREPGQNGSPPPESEPAPESDDSRRQADDDFWQWVALVVLLACWLAEAQM
jgi:hypothetical protein